jgi:hypothetical protein
MSPNIASPDARASSRLSTKRTINCKSLDLFHRSLSDFAIHFTAGITGEAAAILSRTRASLAPAKPVLRILDRFEPLAKLAATR